MDERTANMLHGPPLPLLLKLAAPNSLAFIVQAGVSMAEVWFIGRLGTVSLAAIALVFPLLMLMQTLSGGAMGGAVASSVARAVGAGDQARARRLLWHALALALAGWLVLLLVFSLLGRTFLTALGGSGPVLALALEYALVLCCGGLSIWLLGVVSAIFRGMGIMHLPAGMMVVGAAVQVPLSGALILGGYGLPQLGVVGAAVSVVAANGLISVLMLYRLVHGPQPVKLALTDAAWERAQFRDILRVALPASLSPLLTVGTIVSLTAIVAGFGEKALAGYGIGSRVEFLVVPLVFGLGAAMTSLVGMSTGARDLARAERIGWIGGGAAAFAAGSLGVVLALFADLWIPAFTADPAIHAAARDYIRVVGPFYAFFALGLSLYFASQGAGAMRWPVLATIMRIIVAVCGALLLAHGLGWGLQGVFVASAGAMAVYGLLLTAALRLGAWRRT